MTARIIDLFARRRSTARTAGVERQAGAVPTAVSRSAAVGATITYYRVRQSRTHPERSVRRAWYGRTWQAEWEHCPWCPRAFTRRGVERKARRWSGHNLEWQIRNAHRRQRLRAHLTARRDPFYANLRREGKL